MITVVKQLSLKKAPFPIEVTDAGIVIDVNLGHREKAHSLIDVNELGRFIIVKFTQFDNRDWRICFSKLQKPNINKPA